MRNKWVIIWSGLYNCGTTVNKYLNIFTALTTDFFWFLLRLTLVPQFYSIHKEQPTISSRYFFFRDWCRSRNWLAISLYWSLSCWQVSSSLERINNASFLLSSFLLHTRYCRREKKHSYSKPFLPQPVLDSRASSFPVKRWRKTLHETKVFRQVVSGYG